MSHAPIWPQPIPIIGGTGPKWSGKAQPLDSKILAPTGWIRMGDIREGDEVVNPANGKSCRVIGVFPQGKRKIYRINFADQTWAESCDEHLWAVHWSIDHRYQNKTIVVSLEKIRQELQSNPRRAIHVPLTEPVNFEASVDPLIVDPYLLGLLLGDGGLGTQIQFTSADQEILDSVSARLEPPLRLKKTTSGTCDYIISTPNRGGNSRDTNALLIKLRELGVHGNRSWEKSIPARYQLASIYDRLAILQGLCDTDGSAGPGCCEYTTTSKQLADEVRELVWSLGGRATMVSRVTHCHHKGERRAGRVSYRMRIRLLDGMCPFRLSRKADIYGQPNTDMLLRRIVSVEEVGEKECQCITLDSMSKTYITDNYTVTHNSVFGLNINPGINTTLVYDWEQSTASYEEEYKRIGVPFTRIDVQKEMHNYKAIDKNGKETFPFRSGYKPIDIFVWWRNHVLAVPAGKYSVIMVDPVTDLERGLADWVHANPTYFGHTDGQYAKMSGIMWGDVKDYQKQLLADICAKCQTFYFTAHLGAEFKGNTATGKEKAKGKETLYELASLYLWFDRSPDKKTGTRPGVPSATVKKTRLLTSELKDGEVISYSILPDRLPEATPKAIRAYFLNPAGKRAASEDERAKEEVMSSDERLRLEVAKAEAERDAAQARAAQVQAAKPVVITHAPEEENRNSPESWETNFGFGIEQAETLSQLAELPPQIEAAEKQGFIGPSNVETLKALYRERRAHLESLAEVGSPK